MPERRLAVIALVILLCIPMKGYMSGVKQSVQLEYLLRHSDAVLLVEKYVPYEKKVGIPIEGKAGKEMEAIGFQYKVLKIFLDRTKGIKPSARLLVFSSRMEFNLARARYSDAGGPMPIPMVPTYAGKSADPNLESRLVIFVRTMEGSRFCMTAEDAFEKATWTLDPSPH